MPRSLALNAEASFPTLRAMSNAVTQGIRISVESRYREDQSTPLAGRFVYTYTVRIANEGGATAQLKSRHWIITDGNGVTEEVRGEGVVGNQPVLTPGESFEYTSYCVLKTPHGAMRGSYQMVREDGTSFAADIAPFSLTVPNALN
jgi:ApaG protein